MDRITFRTAIEDQPGRVWKSLFDDAWPSYRKWYLNRQSQSYPGYLECRQALRKYMPELVPTWERLVDLVGGGDLEARFLSLWCPPVYIAGCSQAVWIDSAGLDEPALVRNYDYSPALLEGNWLGTRWQDRKVLAINDCLWGVLDGINESGLVVSLAFGGRTITGTGFGIPLLLRYVLEIASSTAEAIEILQRIPIHMCYNVTLLDVKQEWATVFLSPDRPVEVTRNKVITNHQHTVEWTKHDRATHSVERLQYLEGLMNHPLTLEQLTASMLQPPLYQTRFQRGFGTLYSIVYRPVSGRVTMFWPDVVWPQELKSLEPGEREIVYRAP
jgi:predicted choloylglycine hydrolase